MSKWIQFLRKFCLTAIPVINLITYTNAFSSSETMIWFMAQTQFTITLGISLFCFFSHLFFFPAILFFSIYYAQYFAPHQIICSKAFVYVLCIYRYFYVLICIATRHWLLKTCIISYFSDVIFLSKYLIIIIISTVYTHYNIMMITYIISG